MRTLALCVPLALVAAANGQVTLSANLTADNLFTAYISTDDTVAGTEFLSGASWPQTFSGSVDLTTAGVYYLHVTAVDQGAPAMFIGAFTLSSPAATFENGTQSLLTGDSAWTVSTTAYGQFQNSPTDLGPNGMGPWGSFSAMGDARFIWTPTPSLVGYFSARITVVPAASTAALMGVGGLVAGRRRR